MRLKHYLAIALMQLSLVFAGCLFGMDAVQQLIKLLFFTF